MDVHPPLAKLLITLMAFLFGFKGGSFDFKDIGREYGPDNVPYIAMRMLPATLGLLLIPLAYLTLRALQTRPTTALLGSLFVMFENGLITQSRFILLDSPLIFFTALSIFFWIGFSNENEEPRDRTGTVGPFSRRWWVWLTLTGLALGAVVSCKWVGLFTIATIGVLTIIQLWALLGDLRVPMPLLAKHFAARAVCLIAIPIAFYMSMFAIHFAILNNSGEGDGFMSSEFQHTLAGHGMEDTFAGESGPISEVEAERADVLCCRRHGRIAHQHSPPEHAGRLPPLTPVRVPRRKQAFVSVSAPPSGSRANSPGLQSNKSLCTLTATTTTSG